MTTVKYFFMQGGFAMRNKKKIPLMALMALLVSLGCAREKVDERSMVIFLIGNVTKNNIEVQIGDIVNEKDVIQTGVDSFCDVKIGESLIRVKQKTTVLMSSLVKQGSVENTAVDLTSGKMLCKPKKLMKSETFLVKTPTAVAGVRGTQFTVEADSQSTSRIKVFEGEVKVAKRIKNLEKSIEKVLEAAPGIHKEEKVVITKKDVDSAEKIVDRIMKTESARGEDAAIAAVLKTAGKDIYAGRDDAKKFSPEDFIKDNKEIIQVKEKPDEVIKEIHKIIKIEKETPRPEGRLLVTRYEVYFIKNGKVEWEGSVVDEPLRHDDKLYIASGEYVFCASKDGPVYWRKKIESDGKLMIRKDTLVVPSQGREMLFDLKTGAKR
jgi:hypothetical protein